MYGTVVVFAVILFVPWIYFAIKYRLNIKKWKDHEHLKTRVYWNEHRHQIEKSGICPCCGHTFHILVDKYGRRRIYLPSGVYVTVTKLLSMDVAQESVAICVIIAALDADEELARAIVGNWDQIETVQ
ncbi:hypothetical protein LCGC14_0516630 [marine sediment metagenome]|uniref:Uncharacterized protein n=1 Tax=marine sediment metagenome TaxID=412755 RepID=A0A0F9RZT6_9ZZZZ